jgi:hypothetical protein
MSYYDDDRWEFDPEGEGRLGPDATDASATDDGSHEHAHDDNSLDNDHVGYPDSDPNRDTPSTPSREDRSVTTSEHLCGCGRTIARSRTKCDFCLTNSLDYSDSHAKPDTKYKRKFTGMIHALVDAKTEDNAICKAKAVFAGLTSDPFTTSIDSIDEYEPIADLEGELVARFTRKWGQLPAAAAVETTEGQRQLDIIRQNAGHDYLAAATDSSDGGDDTSGNRPTLDPVLFDAAGEPITDIEDVGQLIAGGSLDRTRPPWETDEYPRRDEPTRIWIVPALAIEHAPRPDSNAPDELPREGRTRRNLACRSCSETTRHEFSGVQDVPVPALSDIPIWKCSRCQSPRHGPDPSSPKGSTNQR